MIRRGEGGGGHREQDHVHHVHEKEIEQRVDNSCAHDARHHRGLRNAVPNAHPGAHLVLHPSRFSSASHISHWRHPSSMQ